MKENNLSEEFEKELLKYRDNGILSAEYRKKKLIIYIVRTVIAIILFALFWKYHWTKWLLIIYVPINLFSLASIFGYKFFLKRKIDRVKDSFNN